MTGTLIAPVIPSSAAARPARAPTAARARRRLRRTWPRRSPGGCPSGRCVTGLLPAGDLHPPPARPVLQVGEGVAERRSACIRRHTGGGVAGRAQLDPLTATQPVHGRVGGLAGGMPAGM